MCVSCGCGEPNDDHGDSRHITLKDVQSAAQAAGIDVQQVKKNMDESLSKATSKS